MYGWRCGNIKIARTNREINKEPAKMLIDIRFDKVMDWDIIKKAVYLSAGIETIQ